MRRSQDAHTRWQAQARAAREALAQWRQQHPTATFTEIEAAVDQQVDALRAQLVAELARASRAADLAAKDAGAPPRCPACGERLVRQGQHRRQVVVQGGQTVGLDRDYAVCPVCGVGLFPPG
jgi:uncharacterized protein with PIN domain